MTNPINSPYQTPVVLIGGGDVAWDAYDSIKDHKYPLIAVDAGALHLADRGIIPDAVIGDLDTFDAQQPQQGNPQIIQISEQDTIDFEKALYTLEAPLYLAFGFWGKRLDHSLAALHVITKYRASKKIVLIDTTDLMFNPQGPMRFPCPKKTRVSVVPLETVTFESSTGLKYPLDGLTLKNGVGSGFSNECSEPQFSMVPTPEDKNNFGIIMPTDTLKSVLTLLTTGQ